jgi:hypothetical protein
MVQLPNQQYANAVQAPDPFGILNGSSIKTLGFSRKDQFGQNISADIGTSYTGILCDDLRTEQVRKYTTDGSTGELDVWPDGRPKWQVIATIQTDYTDPEVQDDDGKRRIFFKSGLLQALQAEMREKHIAQFGLGTRITVTLVGLKPTPNGFPKKLFNVDLEPAPYVSPEQRQTNEALQPAAPVQQQAPVQGAMQQWAQQPQASAVVGQAPQQQAPQGQIPQQAVAPVAPQQPVQQYQQPQPAAPVQQAPQQQVPAAPVGPQITPEMVASFNLLINNGIPESAAYVAVASQAGQEATPEFTSALIQAAAS